MLSLHFCSRSRPWLFGSGLYIVFERNRLHHLTHSTVRQYHRGHTVLIGKLKALYGKICHLLNRSGSQHYHMEVAVRAALCSLEIVRLRRLYSAESRTAALYVDNKRRKV